MGSAIKKMKTDVCSVEGWSAYIEDLSGLVDYTLHYAISGKPLLQGIIPLLEVFFPFTGQSYV